MEQSNPLMPRRAALLSADAVGYSRGRVVDAAGDNLLAEFGSVMDAVESAVLIQHAHRARNAELPAERQMQFRIGINFGDVIVEGRQLYGGRSEHRRPPGEPGRDGPASRVAS